MARGFESKSVADQQESAQDKSARRGHSDEPDPAVILKRRQLELAKTDIKHQLEAARAEPHKEMLRRALAAVEKELGKLS
jgi:hypothetical protein